MTQIKLGIDVGGTFTDIVAVDNEGKFFFIKTPSTPEDQSIGVIKGIKNMLNKLSKKPKDVLGIAHGTTVATNTLLERTGAKTALLTTKGFRDVLEIGRQNRPNLYDLHARKLEPIIPRKLRKEVNERTIYSGEVIQDVEERELKITIKKLLDEGIESLAVCFLHSYANSDNERKTVDIIKRFGIEIPISVSSDILPEFREFERMNTTVLNAYVQPVMDNYVSRLASRVKGIGIDETITIMQSSGGMMTDKVAASRSVHTLLSGPAGGVLAAKYIADNTVHKNLITVDLGGTSCDVSIVDEGEVTISTQGEIEGYPVKFPHIDIHTIGSGGGSIARIDAGGVLKVGPKSAGAVPGPVCYGKGGTKPTVTDAHAVLGRMNNALMGGELELNIEAAKSAIKYHVADSLNITVEEAAEGILKVINSSMVRAIRVMTVEKGIDPRKFSILPFGGAGSLHAVDLAKSLGVKKCIIPVAPGNFSAFGLMTSPMRYDEVSTYQIRIDDLDLSKIGEIYSDLEKTAKRRFESGDTATDDLMVFRSVDLRYYGQAHELNLELQKNEINHQNFEDTVEFFHQLHQQIYGFRKEDDPVELVNLRVSVIAKKDIPKFKENKPRESNVLQPIEIRKVYYDGEWLDTKIYDRENLLVGDSFTGPAIVEEDGSTIVIGVGDKVKVDSQLNLVVDIYK